MQYCYKEKMEVADMAKDKFFKESFLIYNYAINDTTSLPNKYKPDKIFNKDKHTIICEHSSTGDRKVHIAELIQFLAYARNYNIKDNGLFFSFILFLDGKGSNPPTVKDEAERLNYYLKTYYNFYEEKYIKHILILKYTDKCINCTLTQLIKCGIDLCKENYVKN